MELKVIKTLFLIGMIAATFLLGFIPIKWIWHFKGKTFGNSKTFHNVVSLLNCFAGGVFLATCLLDLLPETQESLEKQVEGVWKLSGYPVAQFVMVVGLILIMLTEQIVLTYQERKIHRINFYSLDKTEKNVSIGTISEHCSIKENGRTTDILPVLSYNDTQNIRMNSYGNIARKTENSKQAKDEVCQSSNNNLVSLQSDKNKNANVKKIKTSFGKHVSSVDSSNLRSFLLIFALSLHSIFEGLAVGLQPDVTETVQIFTGIMIHKGVVAVSIGVSLTQSRLLFWASLRVLLVFAVASPIGTAIGLIILEFGSGSSSELAVGILNGLACGTFLYVTFFEILWHEFNNSDIRVVKVLFVFLGFICMSALFLISE